MVLLSYCFACCKTSCLVNIFARRTLFFPGLLTTTLNAHCASVPWKTIWRKTSRNCTLPAIMLQNQS